MTASLIRRSRAQLASAASGSGALVETLATADRLLWLEDHYAASMAAAGTTPAPDRLASGIALRDVTFTYPGTERAVLSRLTLTIPAGATVALVGENGSGKTTLVKLMLGMYTPSSGVIAVDDLPLAEISPAAWRSRCSAAFQDYARLALPAVSSVGAGEVATHSSEPLALAALDRRVSHRFSTVRMADMIVYLDEGHVVEAGSHDDLMAAAGKYAELFTLQAQGYA